MARLFDDAASQFLRNLAVPNWVMPITIGVWFKSDDATVRQDLVVISDGTTSNGFNIQARGDIASDILRCNIQGGGTALAATTTGYTVGQWHRGVAAFRSATSRDCYIDGGSKGSNATSRTPVSVSQIEVGRNLTLGYMSGMIADVTIWNIGLSDAEVLEDFAAKLTGAMIRRDACIFSARIMGSMSPEPDEYGLNLTVTGATDAHDHPPIDFPHRGQYGREQGQAYTELLRAQTILVQTACLDVQAYVESGRAQTILVQMGETDGMAFSELLRAQTVLVQQGRTDVQAYKDSVAQIILAQMGETDAAGFSELLRAQTILVQMGETDALTLLTGLPPVRPTLVRGRTESPAASGRTY